MKIAVLGAGALGCAMGSCLSEAGHEVWLINRRVEHVEAMNQHGLAVRIHGADRHISVKAACDAQAVAAQSGTMDLVVVLVKSFHTLQAMASATSIVGPDTVVLSLQNGLGHEDVLADVVGRDKVVAGKTYAGGVMLGPGHIIRGTEGKETYIGELDGQVSERVQRIAEVFNAAGLITHISDNIVGTMWEKLLVNVATGALSGITHLNYGDLYQVPEVKACALAAVQEAMDVARASGIRLNVTHPEEPWTKAAAGLPPEFKASMLQSLEKGSVTEVDYVNGSVVRWGEKCGVPTPVNRTLVACLKGIERGLAASTKERNMAVKAYVEHVAVRVKDIHWHIRFFYEVLGMDVREIDGPSDDPRQYWTLGGMQLVACPDFEAPPSNDAGWLAHLGVMVNDLEAALQAAEPWGVKALPQGRNWLQLPDGLAVELMQAAPGSVEQALQVNPRAR